MIRRFLFFVCAVALCGAVVWAQAPEFEVNVETARKPWTHLNFKNDARNFQFIIVTDRTGGHRPGVFMEGVNRINLLQPEFVMSVGDLIEGYTEDIERLDREWTEFIDFVNQLEMPFFYVPGNHDITNDVMRKEWEKRFGRSYYHFVYGDVLFLCLNSEDPPSSQISDEQVAYVKQALAENQDVRWTMVFLHKPLWAYGDGDDGWNQVEAMLKDRPHNVYAGHTHHYMQHDRNDSEYIVLATMGGGSQLRGQNFGEFDHFMWVTMTDEGPIMANLMLDGIWDTNVLNEERVGLLRPVVSGAAVRTDGIVIDSPAFQRVATNLRLTNDADIPMEINVKIGSAGAVHPSIRHVSKTVAPNSVEIVPFELASAQPSSALDLAPIRADWTVRYNVPGDLTPLKLRGSHRIIIDTHYDLLPATSEIRVDGILGEWGALPHTVSEAGVLNDDKDSWDGPHDASLSFGVRYDAHNLYIAAAVIDDQIRLDRRPDVRRNDHVRIAIDPSGGSKPDAAIVVPIIAGKDSSGLENIHEGLRAQSIRTDNGYNVELSMPIEVLAASQGDEWKGVRINFAIQDLDSDGAVNFWWRPEWDSPADYTGSGNFLKR